MKNPALEIIRFGCAGGLAMLVHFLIVALLVPIGIHPLAANVAAFAVAFQVSFHAHRGWTFRVSPTRGQYPKMLAVSLTGFAVNEILYYLLLRTGRIGYRPALLIVLLAVAAGTYFASRLWVFRTGNPAS